MMLSLHDVMEKRGYLVIEHYSDLPTPVVGKNLRGPVETGRDGELSEGPFFVVAKTDAEDFRIQIEMIGYRFTPQPDSRGFYRVVAE